MSFSGKSSPKKVEVDLSVNIVMTKVFVDT